jgi:hypothetical protein
VRLSESLVDSVKSSYQRGVLTKMKMRLFESLGNSEVSSDQQGVLTEEDHRCILTIGIICIFLPSSLVEPSACVESEEEGIQQSNIVMEEKEKKLKFSQVMKEEEEHSDIMLTPWEKELKILEV